VTKSAWWQCVGLQAIGVRLSPTPHRGAGLDSAVGICGSMSAGRFPWRWSSAANARPSPRCMRPVGTEVCRIEIDSISKAISRGPEGVSRRAMESGGAIGGARLDRVGRVFSLANEIVRQDNFCGLNPTVIASSPMCECTGSLGFPRFWRGATAVVQQMPGAGSRRRERRVEPAADHHAVGERWCGGTLAASDVGKEATEQRDKR
jgi:hypothetical protein